WWHRSSFCQLLLLDFFPLCLDRFDDLLHIQTHALGLNNELLHFALEKPPPFRRGSARRLRRYRCADSGPHFEPSFLNQILNDTVCRVRMDLEVRGQCSYGREWLAGRELAADKCFFRGIDHLIEDGFPGLQRESHQCHTSTVTLVTEDIKWMQIIFVSRRRSRYR